MFHASSGRDGAFGLAAAEGAELAAIAGQGLQAVVVAVAPDGSAGAR